MSRLSLGGSGQQCAEGPGLEVSRKSLQQTSNRCLVIHAHFTEEETEAEKGDVQGHAASQGTEPGVSEPALSKHLVWGEEGAGLVSWFGGQVEWA